MNMNHNRIYPWTTVIWQVWWFEWKMIFNTQCPVATLYEEVMKCLSFGAMMDEVPHWGGL